MMAEHSSSSSGSDKEAPTSTTTDNATATTTATAMTKVARLPRTATHTRARHVSPHSLACDATTTRDARDAATATTTTHAAAAAAAAHDTTASWPRDERARSDDDDTSSGRIDAVATTTTTRPHAAAADTSSSTPPLPTVSASTRLRRRGAAPCEMYALPRMVRLHACYEQHRRALYRFCAMHVLEWPSLAVEWLPHRRFDDVERDYTLQYLLVGTQVPLHASTTTTTATASRAAPSRAVYHNAVHVLEVAVPITSADALLYRVGDSDDSDDDDDEQQQQAHHDRHTSSVSVATPPPQWRRERGKSFMHVRGHCRRAQSLVVDAAVLKLRAAPRDASVVAVNTASGFVGLYRLPDETTATSTSSSSSQITTDDDDDDGDNRQHAHTTAPVCTTPLLTLRGHRTGGFGLSWCRAKTTLLATGADDGFVHVYDVAHAIDGSRSDNNDNNDNDSDRRGRRQQRQQTGGAASVSRVVNTHAATTAQTHPLQRLRGHRDAVTDVSWHATHTHLLASSSMDGDVRLWDLRVHSLDGGNDDDDESSSHASAVVVLPRAHAQGATAAQLHPSADFLLATAGLGGDVALWDVRRVGSRASRPVLSLPYHARAVTGLQWSPTHAAWLASFAEDGRVVVWDMHKTRLPLHYSSDGTAPPEVAFVHLGHLGRVTDAAWCGDDDDAPLLMASTDTHNGLHVYEPKAQVVLDYCDVA